MKMMGFVRLKRTRIPVGAEQPSMGANTTVVKNFFSLCGTVVQTATKKFFADHGPFLASGLAFDLLLCCLPLPFLFISVFGYTMVGSERALTWVQDTVIGLIPASQELFLTALAHIVEHRTLLGFTGFFLFFIFCTSVFTSARLVVNTIFIGPTSQPFFRGKLRDFLMMAIMSILLILTMIIHSVFTLAQAFGGQHPLIAEWVGPVWVFVGEALVLWFLATLFYLLYRFSPTKRVSQSALIVGSLAGAGLFEVTKLIFSWYVSVAYPVTTLYGALSGMIFFFVWLYFVSLVFILGAEIGCAYEKVRNQPR